MGLLDFAKKIKDKAADFFGGLWQGAKNLAGGFVRNIAAPAVRAIAQAPGKLFGAAKQIGQKVAPIIPVLGPGGIFGAAAAAAANPNVRRKVGGVIGSIADEASDFVTHDVPSALESLAAKATENDPNAWKPFGGGPKKVEGWEAHTPPSLMDKWGVTGFIDKNIVDPTAKILTDSADTIAKILPGVGTSALARKNAENLMNQQDVYQRQYAEAQKRGDKRGMERAKSMIDTIQSDVNRELGTAADLPSKKQAVGAVLGPAMLALSGGTLGTAARTGATVGGRAVAAQAARAAAENAALSGGLQVGSNLQANREDFANLKDVGLAAGAGGVLGGAMPVVGRLFGKLTNTILPHNDQLFVPAGNTVRFGTKELDQFNSRNIPQQGRAAADSLSLLPKEAQQEVRQAVRQGHLVTVTPTQRVDVTSPSALHRTVSKLRGNTAATQVEKAPGPAIVRIHDGPGQAPRTISIRREPVPGAQSEADALAQQQGGMPVKATDGGPEMSPGTNEPLPPLTREQKQIATEMGQPVPRPESVPPRPVAQVAGEGTPPPPTAVPRPEGGPVPPMRERGRSQTLREDPNVPTEIKEQLGQEYQQFNSKAHFDESYSALKTDPNAELRMQNEIEKAVATEDISNPEVSNYVQALTKHYIDIGTPESLNAAANLTHRTYDLYTKAGQFNQAAANLDALGPEGMLRFAEKEALANKVKLSDEFRTEFVQRAKVVSQMPEGVDRDIARFMLMQDLARQMPMGVAEKMITFWKAGLLTGIKTSAGNIFSNTGSLIGEKMSDVFATGIDIGLSAVTKQRSKALTGKGILKGGMDAWPEFKTYLKTGYDPRGVGTAKSEVRKVIHNGDNPLGKALDAYENFVFRWLGSQDFFYYYARKANSLHDQAAVAAKNGLIRKDQIKAFVKNPPEYAVKNATADASYAVFQNDTALGLAAQQFAKNFPVMGNFLAPFRRTPSAVAMRLVDYSPIGAGKQIMAAVKTARAEGGLSVDAQRQLVQGLGRAGTGSALIAAGMSLYNSGILTLSYPKDKKEQELWRMEGKQPYSIKIGGRWRSLNYAAPWGQLLSVGGFFQEGVKQQGSLFGGFTSAVPGGMKTLLDQTFLKGLAGATNAINYPTQFGSKFVEQTVGSIVPTLVRDVSIGLDPVGGREVDSPGDALKAALPWTRQSLTPQTDVFGRVIKKQRSFAEQMLDPTRPSTAIDDPIAKEIRALQQEGEFYVPGRLDKTQKIAGKEFELSRKELFNLQQISGGAMLDQFSKVFQNPAYRGATAEIKRKALEMAADDARAISRVVAIEPMGKGNRADFIKAYSDLSTRQRNMIIGVQPDYVAEVDENIQQKAFKEGNQPDITPELQGKMNAFFALSDGTGAKKQFIAENPDLKAYFDASKAFKAAYEAKFGEDLYGKPVKGGGSGGGGKKRYGFTRRSRRGGRRRSGGGKGRKVTITRSKASRGGSSGNIGAVTNKVKITKSSKKRTVKASRYAPVGRPRGKSLKTGKATIKIRKGVR